MSSRTRVVNIQEAKTHLSRLLRAVEAGEDIAIARSGTVIARLVRTGPPAVTLGLFEGQVNWEDDVFAPMTDDEADVWEGAVEPA